MNKVKSIFKTIISFIKFLLKEFIKFYRRLKSPYLFYLVLFELFLFVAEFNRVGPIDNPYKYIGLIIPGFTLILTIVNEVSRKHHFWPILSTSILIIPKIIIIFYILFIASSTYLFHAADTYPRSYYIDYYQLRAIIRAILIFVIDLIISIEEIYRTNKGPSFEKLNIKKETRQTLSLLFFLFSGLTFIFILYVLYFGNWKADYWPITKPMPATFVVYCVSLIVILVSKKRILTLSLYNIFTILLFIFSCTYLVFNAEIPFFVANNAMVYSALYFSNILFTLGCLFANEKKEPEIYIPAE